MLKINEFVEQSIELEKDNLLTDFPIVDAIEYLKPSIMDQIRNSFDQYQEQPWREFNIHEWEKIVEYFDFNAADLLSITHGYYQANDEICLYRAEEIEVALPETWHLTDSRVETISKFSDLYISDGQQLSPKPGDTYPPQILGYIMADLNLMLKLDIDAIDEYLIEDLGA